MVHKIKSRLDDYLEFDSDKLFTFGDQYRIGGGLDPLIRIFGGAIRDSIADMPIHDVDILVGSQSMDFVSGVLKKEGYVFYDKLTYKDIVSLYLGVKIISEPHTYMKGNKIAQLIRPRSVSQDNSSVYKRLPTELVNKFKEGSITKGQKSIIFQELYQKDFRRILQSVDISCCGVSYDGTNLYENCENAISHCLNKVFVTHKFNAMFQQDRYYHRMVKLQDRGWKDIGGYRMELKRDIKINDILSDDIKYIKETD